MSKVLGFITAVCITLMVSTIALADDTTTETCANGAGIVITGAVSGHKYCQSTASMNWWNAVSWCDALGKRLFDRSDCACGNTTADCRDKCPELVGVGGQQWIWTASSASTKGNYHIFLATGVFDGGSNRERSIAVNKTLCY